MLLGGMGGTPRPLSSSSPGAVVRGASAVGGKPRPECSTVSVHSTVSVRVVPDPLPDPTSNSGADATMPSISLALSATWVCSAVLAAQDHYVWVRVVEVVVELGKEQLFHLSSSPFRHKEEGSATRGVGRGFPPDPPARTAAGVRPGSARPPPRAPLPRSDPPPCRAGPFAPLSCGGWSPSLACPRVHIAAS